MTMEALMRDAIEKAARAHYEKYFEGVMDLEGPWRDHGMPHRDESYWHRMYQAQIAGILAFLAAADQNASVSALRREIEGAE